VTRHIVEILRQRAQLSPEKMAYTFLNKCNDIVQSLNYLELYSQARRLASVLLARQVSGRLVALMLPDGPRYVISLWACLISGATVVPLTKGRGQAWDLSIAALKSCQPVLVITDAVRLSVLDSTAEIVDFDLLQNASLTSGSDFPEPDIDADRIAIIQYTSGSSGQPKGVRISHGNLLHNLHKISEAFGCIERDIGLSWLPLYHDMGLIGHVLQPVYAGVHNYFLPSAQFVASPVNWLKAISRYGITISGGPNFAYRYCLQKADPAALAMAGIDLSCWRVAYCGAECISAETLRAFAERLASCGFSADRFFPCYGLAESTLLVTGRFGIATISNPQAEGGLLSWVAVGPVGSEVCVVDSSSGRRVGPDQIGEIWLQSGSVARGYHDEDSRAHNMFGARLIGTAGQFFRTGDLGLVHNDELYVTGRIRNLLKVRGRSLHAEDLEAAVQRVFNADGVVSCVVLGIHQDGAEEFAVLLGTAARKIDSQLADVAQRVRSYLCEISGLMPVKVLLVPAVRLPLTTSGKIRRSECIRIFNGAQNG
jgi:acyl-CoA synthetase (AMP-forming)/AMP-acid ligase II